MKLDTDLFALAKAKTTARSLDVSGTRQDLGSVYDAKLFVFDAKSNSSDKCQPVLFNLAIAAQIVSIKLSNNAAFQSAAYQLHHMPCCLSMCWTDECR